MGTITEFHFRIKLKKDLPGEVLRVLAIIERPDIENFSEYVQQILSSNKHDFFLCERWLQIFNGSAFQDKDPKFHINANGYGVLELHGELKNYDSEIDKFADWISPYIVGRKKRIYLGWKKGDYEFCAPQFHFWYHPQTIDIYWGTTKNKII